MTVLSDITLRQEIEAGKLVRDANAQRAEHCSYEFAAGRIYFGGTDSSQTEAKTIDLVTDTSRTAMIQPGALVWIRSRETVVMPNDKVGVWIQTNTLSRKGLLLLNMSLVEPGYEGFLTAVFVNFGKIAVPIDSQTKIAKLMFLCMDKAAKVCLSRIEPVAYDSNTLATAAAAPSTFIRIEEFLPDFEKAEKGAIDNIDAAVKKATAETATETKNAVLADTKAFLWKASGGFLAGAALFFVGMTFLYFTVFPVSVNYAKEWSTIADESVKRMVDSRTAEKAEQDLRVLAEELRQIKLKMNALESATACGESVSAGTP